MDELNNTTAPPTEGEPAPELDPMEVLVNKIQALEEEARSSRRVISDQQRQINRLRALAKPGDSGRMPTGEPSEEDEPEDESPQHIDNRQDYSSEERKELIARVYAKQFPDIVTDPAGVKATREAMAELTSQGLINETTDPVVGIRVVGERAREILKERKATDEDYTKLKDRVRGATPGAKPSQGTSGKPTDKSGADISPLSQDIVPRL